MKSDIALAKLTLYKELGEGKYQVLNFGVYREVLRLYVKEGDGTSKQGKNLLNMPIMFLNARAFFLELEKLNTRDTGYNMSFDMYGPKWDENSKRIPNARELIGKIGVARMANSDGEITNLIFVVNGQNVKKVFPLIPTPYLDLYRNGKKIEDKTELTDMWTEAYIKSFGDILAALPEVNNEKETIAEAKAAKGGGSSFNNKKYSKINEDDLLKDL